LLAFLSLIFLIIECHDWLHVTVARLLCGCWGVKGFEDWKICDSCILGKGEMAIVWFAGPLINYVLIWVGWLFMGHSERLTRKSLGFFLVYASSPLARILAAKSGGTDETNAFRSLFQRSDGSNHYWVALASLMMILILTVPPIIRSIGLISGWLRRVLIIPLFLIAPMYLDRWIAAGVLPKLLRGGFLSGKTFIGAQTLVFAWLAVVVLIFGLTRKSLTNGLIPSK